MNVGMRSDDAALVLDYVERHRDRFAADRRAPFDVVLHRRVYLSTLFRVTSGGDRYLFAIKHHDPQGRRAEREFQVLSVFGGSLSPRPVLFDNTRTTFADPVVVSTFERPTFVKVWDDANLERLARLLATIHASADLMDLPVDRDRPPAYSLAREFRDEIVDVDGFRDTPLKRRITGMIETLLKLIPTWEPVFADGVVTYIHSDLPHHHVFALEPQWQTVHWEWSRRSHPSRELARALWDMELPPDREQFLIDRYQELVPFTVSRTAIDVQRLLQSFYNCVHVAFWLDRCVGDERHDNWRKAERLADVVRLWIRMQVDRVA